MEAAEFYKHLRIVQYSLELARWNARLFEMAMDGWPNGCAGNLDNAAQALQDAAEGLLFRITAIAQDEFAGTEAPEASAEAIVTTIVDSQEHGPQAPVAEQEQSARKWPFTCVDCGRGMEAHGVYTGGLTNDPRCLFCAKKRDPGLQDHNVLELHPAPTQAPSTPPKRGRGRPKKSHEGDLPATTVNPIADPVDEDTAKAALEQFQVRLAERLAPAEPVADTPQADPTSMDRHFKRIERIFSDGDGEAPEEAIAPESAPSPESTPPTSATVQDDFLDDLTF